MEKASVIVPVYNGEKYIKRCIESLLIQNYEDYEIIIVDDGSNDDTASICKDLCERADGIKYIYINNAGVSNARNIGFRESEGQYILFVDADDTVQHNYIKRLVEAVDGFVMAMCGWYDVNRNYEPDYFVRDINETLWFITAPTYGHYLAVWNKIFRREFMTAFRTELGYLEDGVFIYEYLQNANGQIAFIPDKLYCYRNNGGSVTREFSLSEKKVTAFQARQIMIELANNRKLKELCQAKYHETVSYILFNSYSCGYTKEIEQYVHLLDKYSKCFFHSNAIARKVKLRYWGYQIILKLNLGVNAARIWNGLRIHKILSKGR